MKIAIIGAGGIGGYFGARLVQAGNDVTFLARGKHLNVMREKGLYTKSILGDFEVKNIKATDKISEIGQTDLVILCLKAWQIKDILEDLKGILHADTIILPLQNGVVTANELAEIIHEKHILGGFARIISKIEAPSIINHMGAQPTIVFGERNKTKSERVKQLYKSLDVEGIKVVLSEDIEADLWKKFIFICLGGLMAVTNTTCGELRELKETRLLMSELLEEIFLLSKKIGIHLKPEIVENTISFFDTLPYDSTFSLSRDIWEGKPSEIEYQNGTVVHLAEKHSIRVPVNRFVYYSILPKELKARRK